MNPVATALTMVVTAVTVVASTSSDRAAVADGPSLTEIAKAVEFVAGGRPWPFDETSDAAEQGTFAAGNRRGRPGRGGGDKNFF